MSGKTKQLSLSLYLHIDTYLSLSCFLVSLILSVCFHLPLCICAFTSACSFSFSCSLSLSPFPSVRLLATSFPTLFLCAPLRWSRHRRHVPSRKELHTGIRTTSLQDTQVKRSLAAQMHKQSATEDRLGGPNDPTRTDTTVSGLCPKMGSP